MPATAADRCARYRERLDAHLAKLPSDAARRELCDRLFREWEGLYAQFQVDAARGRPVDGCAADYVITLCDIENRRTKYGPAMQAVA